MRKAIWIVGVLYLTDLLVQGHTDHWDLRNLIAVYSAHLLTIVLFVLALKASKKK